MLLSTVKIKNDLNYSKNVKNMYNTLVFHIFDSL